MSADDTRRGLKYQDQYLLLRLLREAGAQLEARLSGSAQTGRIATLFGVEARPSFLQIPDADGPSWDVVAQRLRELEAIEVKSGLISRKERIVFWRRLRRELSTPWPDKVIVPVLVGDPLRATDLERWEELAALAATSSVQLGPNPAAVHTTRELLEEALWHLCLDPAASTLLSSEVALAALSRLRLERHVAAELTVAVARGVGVLFTNGLTEQIEDIILGWLARRATATQQGERFVSVENLLAQMQVFEFSASLAPGAMAQWRELRHDLPLIFDSRVQTRLGESGHTLDPARTQPAVLSAIEEGGVGGRLLLGHAGAGKTTLLDQCARRERDAGAEIFCASADSVTGPSQLDALFDSLRFSRALLSIQSPERRFCLAVDGLDEVQNHALQTLWAQHLEQFAVGEQTLVLVTSRQAAWETRQELRDHLRAFAAAHLDDWTESLVKDLLAETPGAKPVSVALLTLLRRPIFLDLFWRTFVEPNGAAEVLDTPPVETRFGLLRAFWNQRLLRSRRPRPPGFAGHLGEVLGHAAANIGSFETSRLDEPTIAVLVSEGVLVPEGGSSFRGRFRHPLLRDFALAFWCLLAEDAAQAAGRWHSISGGLQKQGTLRAIFDALTDAEAEAEIPRVDLAALIAILASQPEAAGSLARLLGTLERSPELDPGTWPERVRRMLPGSFGRELVAAARPGGNGLWAQAILGWPLDAGWLDEAFPAMLRDYTETLYHRSTPHWLRPAGAPDNIDPAVLSQARLAARKLRSVAVHERFAASFSENSRHLKSTAIELVMALLPGEETFCWVERELPVATYHTRRAILNKLPDLAGVDPARAAAIYRQVIGLERVSDGTATLDQERWGGPSVDYHAIDVVLGGRAGRPSLMVAHPHEFVPVALDLVEALFAREHPLPAAPELWSDLIGWHNFWSQDHHSLWLDRCLHAMRQACGQILTTNPAKFLREVAPRLRSSRSTAVQSIYLDVLLENSDDAEYAEASRAVLFDPRLYAAHWLLHWMEEALRRFWPTLDPDERTGVLRLIDEMAGDAGASYRRVQLLATLPPQELTDPRLQALAVTRAANYHETPHPSEPLMTTMEGFTNSSDDLDAGRIETWPPAFDAHALRTLSLGHRLLADHNAEDAAFQEHLPPMLAAAEGLIAALEEHQTLFDDPRRDWMWGALAICVEKSVFERLPVAQPSEGLIERCVRMSVLVLEQDVPTAETLAAFHGHPWGLDDQWSKALGLADAALVWPPFWDDEPLQRRFEEVWMSAFATNAPAVQVTITQKVRPCHWLRNEARQRLEDELVWTPPRDSTVLMASLARLGWMDDVRRTRFLRRLLRRTSLGEASCNLCDHVGGWMGRSVMAVWPSGKRPMAVELIDEVLGSLDDWELLRDPVGRGRFLRSFVVKMQEVAGKNREHATELAADYARWNLAVWRAVRNPAHDEGQEDREIAFLPLLWLRQSQPGVEQGTSLVQADTAAMRMWWRELQPFCRSLAEAGTVDDVSYLLQNLRPGQMNHVLQATEVFEWIDVLLDRLAAGVNAGTVSLDQPPTADRHQTWREVLQQAVNALDSLRVDNLLESERHRERAFCLLERLASAPFDVRGAPDVLQLFMRD